MQGISGHSTEVVLEEKRETLEELSQTAERMVLRGQRERKRKWLEEKRKDEKRSAIFRKREKRKRDLLREEANLLDDEDVRVLILLYERYGGIWGRHGRIKEDLWEDQCQIRGLSEYEMMENGVYPRDVPDIVRLDKMHAFEVEHQVDLLSLLIEAGRLHIGLGERCSE